MSGESSSRTNLEIPQAQKDLLNAFLTLDQASINNSKSEDVIKQMKHISEYTNNTLEGMNKMYKRKTTLIKIPICEPPAKWIVMSENVKKILHSIGINTLN